MNIKIIQVGQTKEAPIKTLESEYEKRLKAFIKLETIVVPPCKKDNREEAQKEEAIQIKKHINTTSLTVALDEHGEEMTSEEFAKWINTVRDFGEGKIEFIIGGSHGLHKDITASAKTIISFSKMTFTHEMIRVFLKEQLYRAFMILSNKTYHK